MDGLYGFISENPSINGWFWGIPILGNFHMWNDTAIHTADKRNPASPKGWLKPSKSRNKPPFSTGAGFFAPTVVIQYINMKSIVTHYMSDIQICDMCLRALKPGIWGLQLSCPACSSKSHVGRRWSQKKRSTSENPFNISPLKLFPFQNLIPYHLWMVLVFTWNEHIFLLTNS